LGSFALSSPSLSLLGPPPLTAPPSPLPPLLQNGSTALHLASGNGQSAVVEALLAKGADVGATNKVRGRRVRGFDVCLHVECRGWGGGGEIGRS